MGGESIYDEGTFEDEISQRLRFNRRGLLAMANMGQRHTNGSQFFFTLDRADNLYGANTLFGTVTGDTLFNLLKFNELELDESGERPVYPPTVKSVEVVDNPFTDIEPRITAAERKEQAGARKEMKKARSKDQKRGKAIK
jgi:peptidyl-prolyl cis-trans isomerase SDCCAG10